jgi:hypothetical protein
MNIQEFNPNQFRELAAATDTAMDDVKGASVTSTGLQPIKYVQEVVDAAKQQFYFANFVRELTVEPGQHQISIPIKQVMMENSHSLTSDMTWNSAGASTSGGGLQGGSGAGTGPYANTVADISFTDYDPFTSRSAIPLPHGAGFTFRRYILHTNMLNLLEQSKEDLSYAIGARIDKTIALAFGSNDKLTFAQVNTRGATQLYGGDALGDDDLTTGDVFTTDLIADASRYLKGIDLWYRDGTVGREGTLTLDSDTFKNGWMPTPDDPFVLFIGVAQEATLRKDSQFVNASEYGSDTVVQNGEIGKYLDTRIVVTNHVEQVAASGTGPDNTTVAAGLAGGMTRCVMMKGKQALALVWGKQPEIRVVDWAISDQMLVILWAYYDVVVLHSDAVVCIDVANN